MMNQRLHSEEWADSYNKLEKYLRPQLENFVIDLFMSADRQSMDHFMKSLNRVSKHDIKVNMEVVPMICKFGY